MCSLSISNIFLQRVVELKISILNQTFIPSDTFQMNKNGIATVLGESVFKARCCRCCIVDAHSWI